jgi:c(7)-type cytochrome triheme protein
MRPIRPQIVITIALLASARMALTAKVPGDIDFKRVPESEAAEVVPVATFSHWEHRMRFTCNVCHPAIFPMKAKGAPPITMDEIKEGKACGVCHNGRAIFGSTVSTCVRCHPRPLK